MIVEASKEDVWIGHIFSDQLERIDAGQDEVVAIVDLDRWSDGQRTITGVAASEGSVWVTVL